MTATELDLIEQRLASIERKLAVLSAALRALASELSDD